MICDFFSISGCSITLEEDKVVDDVDNTTPCMAYPQESYSKTVGVRVGLESSLSEGRLSGHCTYCRLDTEINEKHGNRTTGKPAFYSIRNRSD